MPREIESNPKLTSTTRQALQDIRGYMEDADQTRLEAFNDYATRINASKSFRHDTSEPMWIREKRVREIDSNVDYKMKKDEAFKREYLKMVELGSRLKSALMADAPSSDEIHPEVLTMVLMDRQLTKIRDKVNSGESQQTETLIREKILTPIKKITHQVFGKGN